jgi:hypothetical protein
VLEDLKPVEARASRTDVSLLDKQQAFGYTQEDVTLLMSPMALPLGWFAREQIRRSRENGERLCTIAMALGAVGTVVWLVGGVMLYLWWSTL